MPCHCTQLNEGAGVLLLEPQLDRPRKESPLSTTVACGLDVPRARRPLLVALPTYWHEHQVTRGQTRQWLLAPDLQNDSEVVVEKALLNTV